MARERWLAPSKDGAPPQSNARNFGDDDVTALPVRAACRVVAW